MALVHGSILGAISHTKTGFFWIMYFPSTVWCTINSVTIELIGAIKTRIGRYSLLGTKEYHSSEEEANDWNDLPLLTATIPDDNSMVDDQQHQPKAPVTAFFDSRRS